MSARIFRLILMVGTAGSALSAMVFSGCASTAVDGIVRGDLQTVRRHFARQITAAELSETGAVAFLMLTDVVDSDRAQTDTAAANAGVPQPPAQPTFGCQFVDGVASFALQMAPGLRVVERAMMEQLLAERDFNYQGTLTADKMRNLGEFTAARYLFTGSYQVFQYEVEVVGRLIDVADGVVVAAAVGRVHIDNDVQVMLGLPQYDRDAQGTVATAGPGDAGARDAETVFAADDGGSGPAVMAEARFTAVVREIRRTAFDDDRIALIRMALADQPLSVNQVARVLAALSWDDSRQSALELLYGRVVDRENAYVLPREFSFSSNAGRAAAYIESAAAATGAGPVDDAATDG